MLLYRFPLKTQLSAFLCFFLPPSQQLQLIPCTSPRNCVLTVRIQKRTWNHLNSPKVVPAGCLKLLEVCWRWILPPERGCVFFFFRGIATRELEGVDSAKIGKKWTSRVRNAIIADISHRIHVWYTYLPIKKSTIHGSVYIFTWILYWFLILHIIWLYSKRSEKSPTWTWQGMKTLWFRF